METSFFHPAPVICLLGPQIGQVQPAKEPLPPFPILTHSTRTNGCVPLLFSEKAPIELCVCASGGYGYATYDMLVALRLWLKEETI